VGLEDFNSPSEPMTGNVVQGNLIGTDATGMHTIDPDGRSLGNAQGLEVAYANGNDIEGNVIAGNNGSPADFGAGISVFASSNNLIRGNAISRNNGNGVSLAAGSSPCSGNVIQSNVISQNSGNGVLAYAPSNTVGGTASGTGNTISGNGGAGVFVGSGVTGVATLGNSISANGGLGIGLVNGGNDNQAAPALSAAYTIGGSTVVLGTLTSTPNATFRVEFFANAAGDPEGRTLLGSCSVTTDATGHGSFTAVLSAVPPADQGLVTGTATSAGNDTSLFSAGVTAIPLPPSSLSGVVWEDFNNDGQVDFGERGIAGVTVTLAGTDFLGNAVNLPQTTDGDGAYVFLNLLPGSYTLTETQPAGYTQGINTVGTAGGSLAASRLETRPYAPDHAARRRAVPLAGSVSS
jgi:hypothetical protein